MSVLQLVVLVGVGLFVIHFARSTYSQPEAIRQRWFPELPNRAWALKLLRGFAVFWIFGGFLLISQGIATLPVISEHRGLRLLLLVVVVAVAGTALVVSNTPRRQSEC
jgi:hypothetical protein